jgi:hypothetical protein
MARGRTKTIGRALGASLALIVAFFAMQTCATSGATRSPGARMHRAKCGACHVRPKAERFDREEWTEIIADHHERVPLSKPEREALIDHLSAPSERSHAPTRASAPAL